MRYLILIHSNATAESAWAGGERQLLDATHAAVRDELLASGELVDSNELDTEDVVVLGHHRGEPVVSRGPFTEGTEWIGGYYLVEVADRQRAVVALTSGMCVLACWWSRSSAPTARGAVHAQWLK